MTIAHSWILLLACTWPIAIFGFGTSACAAQPDNAQLNNSPPNIVLVMADDQGWGDMAYNGHETIQTPNFDRAAATGLQFNRFYAAAPVCSPTRASVLTGRHPNRMGVFKWGYALRPHEVTLAELLRSAGYATAHFGKWHLGSVRKNSKVHPGHAGFETWLSAPNFFDNDPILCRMGKAEQFTGESSMVTVDAAIDWIQEKSKTDRPYFAVVWFGSPHAPHRADERDRKLYASKAENLQHFYGEVTGMDRAFGKLRDTISRQGDDTILWYCSDNGALPKVGNTGGHRGYKADVYDGGLLVPSILEWPAKIKSHRKIEMRCNTCDIFPTLLAISGASVEDDRPLDGLNLLPTIEGSSQLRDKPMGFWDYKSKGLIVPSAKLMSELLAAQNQGKELAPDEVSQTADQLPSTPYPLDSFSGHSAWIDGDWKLHRIENVNGNDEGTRWELYDLAIDRVEEKNLAEREPERVATMRDDLESWLRSVTNSLNGNDY